MDSSQYSFQNHSDFLREHVLKLMETSSEYNDMRLQFSSILLLADRVLCACKENIEFSRVFNVGVVLDDLAGTGNVNQGEGLNTTIELWLKAVLWLAVPYDWARMHTEWKQYTLFPVIRTLGLLTQAELELKVTDLNQFQDEVRKHVFIAKLARDSVTHQTQELDHVLKICLLPATLITLLAPIYKHYGAISKNLRGLITTNELKNKEIEGLLKTISSERGAHLKHFAGRHRLITDLLVKLKSDTASEGGYLLLTATEGSGKSAIIAKVTDELVKEITHEGVNSIAVRRDCPWLPGVLLHLGKQSNQPHEIVKSLIIQANSMLLNRVPLPEFHSTEAKDLYILQNENYMLNSQLYQTGVQLVNKVVSQMVEYKRLLYLALERVVQERGDVVLIIDAVDEISMDGSDLAFLPERLPNGATSLLTAKSGTGVVSWLNNNRIINEINLPNLSRPEIPLLTGIKDTDGNMERDFNDKVWRESSGWALIVAISARSIRDSGGHFQMVEVEGRAVSVLERQASEWNTLSTRYNEVNVLHEILLFLAIFEPVSPVDLELVQAYIEYLGVLTSLAEIRSILRPISAQLEGLDANRVKLGLTSFSIYVRNTYCSMRDLKRVLEKIIDWLSQDKEVQADIIAHFLKYWTDNQLILNEQHRTIANKLIEKLANQGATNQLHNVALYLWHNSEVKSELAIECITFSAKSGYVPSMLALGGRLLDGIGTEVNTVEGETWLRQAASIETKAMLALGGRLIDGEGLMKDVEEGRSWIRKAAEKGDLRAMGFLGSRLLSGVDGFSYDAVEGEGWLTKAAESGYLMAMGELGDRLLDGENIQQNIIKGEYWLKKAADLGYEEAMFDLAIRKIDGFVLTQNIQEGEQRLRLTAESAYKPAMFALGERLINGINIKINFEEGMQWVLKAVVAEYPTAIHFYAIRLLTGNGIPSDPSKGIEMLKRASDLKYTKSMVELGNRLMKGNGVAQNEIEGEKLLRMAVKSGDVTAMGTLGYLLIDGSGVACNKEEGHHLLEQAITSNGDSNAAFNLGMYYYEIKEFRYATIFFRLSARLGHSSALINFAYMIRRGEAIDDSLPNIEELLQSLVDEKDPFSLVNLALSIISEGDDPTLWQRADQYISTIDNCDNILAWWYQLSMEGDPEGHLVIAWLVRHGKLIDPDKMALAERMVIAERGLWTIPEWMKISSSTEL